MALISGYINTMSQGKHIPRLNTITDFYDQLRIGIPQSNEFAVMRIEDQPDTKRKEMPLFRCNFYRLVLFTSPGVAWHLPDQQFSNSVNSMYFAYPGKLESWVSSQKIHGFLVCFTEEFAQLGDSHSSFDSLYPFFNFEGQSLIRFGANESDTLKATLNQMLAEMGSSYTDKAEMLRALLHQYLIQIRRIYTRDQATVTDTRKNGNAIFNRFRKEVDQYFTALADQTAHEQASVSLIAEKVNLNPSYLNTVIKELTGSTASSYIHHKTALEAKSYLMHTDLQIAEISHRLGFTNVSYFNRFFKRLTLETPVAFRKAQS
ncbi:MAG: hypothetical protein Roseis2KO_12730 [Roseivirga sp.]